VITYWIKGQKIDDRERSDKEIFANRVMKGKEKRSLEWINDPKERIKILNMVIQMIHNCFAKLDTLDSKRINDKTCGSDGFQKVLMDKLKQI